MIGDAVAPAPAGGLSGGLLLRTGCRVHPRADPEPADLEPADPQPADRQPAADPELADRVRRSTPGRRLGRDPLSSQRHPRRRGSPVSPGTPPTDRPALALLRGWLGRPA